MKTSLSLIVPLLAAVYVQAHGYVHQITIDGKSFIGNVPNADPKPSIIRQINDVSPVKGAKNQAVNCGPGAGPADLIGDAQPGSKITFDWRGGDNSNWPHNTGPMLTYMASCGSTACDKFDSETAKWFKVEQTGRKANGGDWVQADLMKGATADMTLPENLAPGNYLIRHEIIALHLAEQQGGAEFYPSCAQIKVGGSGTGKPAQSDLVSLPGAYTDNDAGIKTSDAFNARANYQFPGPKIASFVSGATSTGGSSNDNGNNSGNDDDNSDDNSGSATSTGKPTATGAPKPTGTKGSSSSGSCKLKKTKTAAVGVSATIDAKIQARSTGIARPHKLSRVMRDLISTGRHSHAS